ncbi:hypothetical protein LvStA_04637 [Burkholderia gladioli]|nr:hypothetical protein LvStA_04637 [Burkholderia gladioli]
MKKGRYRLKKIRPTAKNDRLGPARDGVETFEADFGGKFGRSDAPVSQAATAAGSSAGGTKM